MTTRSDGHVLPVRRRQRQRPLELTFELDEFKLHIPRLRAGMVSRTGLVDRFVTPWAGPVATVVAPAGYGKSTLLAQWAERGGPRVAWLSADDRDNDPVVLLTYLAVALDRVEPIERRVFRSLASFGAGVADVARLANSIASMEAPVVIIIDHAEAITNLECRDIVAELVLRLPTGSQLVIGSRQEPPVPVARLRSQGGILEVGVDDLAMDGDEARQVLAGAGVELPDAELEELVERTEGWPAGLYLAALAISSGDPRPDVGFMFTGEDRFMGDYLRSEFLSRVSGTDVAFLTRTSILERLNGPLCDAVVGTKGSGVVLDRLERRNLLVIPLDRRGEWYRYHHLFREMLHSELLRREPELVAALHLRAATWHEANQLPEAAITHAQQAGDADRVADLVLRMANPVWASGRQDTVLRWMEWFSTYGPVERHPAVAVHGALMYALVGQSGDAERWTAAAERTAVTGRLADGNTMEATLSYLRALLCRHGPDEMRSDAETALQGLSPASPYRPAMLHALGLADLLEDDPEQADLSFARAVDEATSAGIVPYVPVLLAERGIVATLRGDWAEAEALSAQALRIMQGGQFDDYWTSALIYAWCAGMASRGGDVEQARQLVTRVARLRTLLTYALPIVSVQALLELARAYLALADPGGARAALRQVQEIQRHRPELGTLSAQAAELRSRLELLKAEMLGASSLTTAELRLVPWLPTHLSFVEISKRLYVSRNTVKTHAHSIYRKLGASTRSESITRLQQLGLISHS